MYGTIIQQGSFTSNGSATTLKIRSDLDYLQVYNWTTMNAGPAATTATEFKWFRGMANNDAMVTTYTGAGTFLTHNTAANLGVGGFSLINTSTLPLGALTAVTAGTNATQPVYSTGNTHGISAGAIVRLSSTAHTDVNGLDFSIDTVIANTSFRLANTLATAPGAIAGAAGFYRVIANNLEEYTHWYPSVRVISNITQAAAGVVTTLVDHGLTTGQTVRMQVPSICGMTELNGQLVTVTVLTASTFSINVDTTGYTAFAFPTIAQFLLAPYHATMTPVGIAQAYNTAITSATDNKNYIGIKLAAGAQSPAGANGNVIYWLAAKAVNM